MRGRLPFSALIELHRDKGHLQRERSYVHRNCQWVSFRIV